MVDYDELKFGDVIYNIRTKLQVFEPRKISKIDENGVEWFRYNKDRYKYDIEEYKYIGRAEVHIFGEVDEREVDETKYFFSYKDTEKEYFCKREGFENELQYRTLEEAQDFVAKLVEKDKELDRP